MTRLRCVKMDEVMKNMLIHALRDVFREEKEQGKPIKETGDLILKLAGYEERNLYMTDEEHQKIVLALNCLRDDYIIILFFATCFPFTHQAL